MKAVQTKAIRHLRHHIGYNIIGPIIHRWLLGLEQHIAFFDDGDTRFLFCARAGVRIRELYCTYLNGRGRVLPDGSHMFWVSRLALCKGLYGLTEDTAANVISAEYQGQPIRSIVAGLFRHAPELLRTCDLTTSDLDSHSSGFDRWLQSGTDTSRRVLDYLNLSSKAFTTELDALLQGAGRAVLIDSGWQGTGQSLLHHARPDVEWYGLYIGRILTPVHDKAITDRVIGLLFQNENFNPSEPETAIALHRHLFETLLEPNGPSVEEIVGGPCNSIAKAQIQANEDAELDEYQDQIFILVREYIKDHSMLGLAEILSRHQAAIPELARILSQPNQDEAMAIFAKNRSADFGKDLTVPVLTPETDVENPSSKYTTRDSRIQHALWPQGQIALEYNGKLRKELQLRASGLADDRSYFDSASEESTRGNTAPSATPTKNPLVAIITRTKNRPLLLARAAESVSCQRYENYTWVVVNDGGDEDVVREVISKCSVNRRQIRLLSNDFSLGMEAASNVGIRHVECDYILIHDDDDSLHPDFLRMTVEYLESDAGARYGGVTTKTKYISEEIRGDQVVVHDCTPYMDWVRNIQLSELMAQNLFAPISFLYRRKVYEEIGGYNQDLPVLGDWYFNLEFVLRADIKVFGGEALAYYHHRDCSDSLGFGNYSNSVIGGQSKHEEFASISRNMFLRKYGDSNSVATGLVGAYFAFDMRNRLEHQANYFQKWSNNDQHTFSRGDLKNAYDEVDRLWLLSQFHNWENKNLKATNKSEVEINTSFSELAVLFQKNELHIAKPESFDDTLYLQSNPDVEAAINSGKFQSGYQHYVLHGRKEQRFRATAVVRKI
jgi:glycosyltransferase involved in cell wall biosynthesis